MLIIGLLYNQLGGHNVQLRNCPFCKYGEIWERLLAELVFVLIEPTEPYLHPSFIGLCAALAPVCRRFTLVPPTFVTRALHWLRLALWLRRLLLGCVLRCNDSVAVCNSCCRGLASVVALPLVIALAAVFFALAT